MSNLRTIGMTSGGAFTSMEKDRNAAEIAGAASVLSPSLS